MIDDFTQEERDLRETLAAVLQHAGIEKASEKVYLHAAQNGHRGYLLTAHSEVVAILGKHLAELGQVKSYGPVWIILANEANEIVRAWRALVEAKKL